MYLNSAYVSCFRFKFVYLIFYLLGVGTLLPWNMFITAKDVSLYIYFSILKLNSCI